MVVEEQYQGIHTPNCRKHSGLGIRSICTDFFFFPGDVIQVGIRDTCFGKPRFIISKMSHISWGVKLKLFAWNMIPPTKVLSVLK